MHPLVLGELACGNLKRLRPYSGKPFALTECGLPRTTKPLQLIESGGFAGCSIGWIDAHLVASALLTRLHFLDTRCPAQKSSDRRPA